MTKIEYHNGIPFNPETGERYTNERLESFNDEILFNEEKKNQERAVKHGLNRNYKLTKIHKRQSSKKKVKAGYPFNKMHEVLIEIVNSGEYNSKELACILGFSSNVQYPDNDVKINDEYLTFKEFGQLYDCSINTMTKVIKKLEEKEIIKVIRGSKVPPVIYFNPFIVCSGADVSPNIHDMFEDTQYNDLRGNDNKESDVIRKKKEERLEY